ncbi:DUF4166 domain-containing protein [Microbacterium sulfonylureivorans]|uniref:DUF4166 domain-containing protein n=1 Tax=Microbacterium sulfonylureivorans TaxID=2486854 RepID=UPI0013DF0EC6|nr:DUF4166 domain-containing protein [Microbacterium sulfonylureivorans]
MTVEGQEPATGATPPSVGAQSVEPRHSVYQQALGAEFHLLDPNLQKYFGPIPHGWVGSGSGLYAVAGSRHRVLRPVLALMAWRHILFPELEQDVPFAITNRPCGDGSLSAVRTFEFARRTRVMEDTMTVENGQLRDRLGKRRGLEVGLQLAVVSGGLRMTSTSLALRVGRLRIPLPRVAALTLNERTNPTDPTRQDVDVRISTPFLHEVFRYAGTFAYQLHATGGVLVAERKGESGDGA